MTPATNSPEVSKADLLKLDLSGKRLNNLTDPEGVNGPRRHNVLHKGNGRADRERYIERPYMLLDLIFAFKVGMPVLLLALATEL